ncbi:hypothetical protein NX059_008649 [Plenodomus lindquistii]|nr:hypothetical protein NX059_008649 [Plenodomus lindquistii]
MAMLAAADTTTALNKSGSNHTTLFKALLDDNKLAPHKCNAGAVQRRGFGPTDAHYPQLSREIAPYSKSDPLTLQELQDMCLRELSRVRDYFGDRPIYWAPSGDDEDASEANGQGLTLQLIRSLTDPDIIAKDAVACFPSEALDQICIDADLAPPDDILHTSHATCTIISKDTLIPLQHSNEGTTTVTVLVGSMIWIIWPPTLRNLNILQTAYEAFAPECKKAALDVTRDLEGGIVLQQIEGEGLRIPPYCPMMGLPLHTSVLATTSTTTVGNFISMLQKAPLLKAWFRTEIDGKRKQSEFVNRMLNCLDLLLNGEMDPDSERFDMTLALPRDGSGPLNDLLTAWDNIKDGLAELLGPADATALADIWADFLIDAKGRECRICGWITRNKLRMMRGHFVEQHWVKEKGKKRMDSAAFDDQMEGQESDGAVDMVASIEGAAQDGMHTVVD